MDNLELTLYIAKPKITKMNPKLFAWLFFVLGLVFATSSMLFSVQQTRYLSPGLSLNGNIGYGSIAAAIIAVGCFISSVILMRNKPTV
jgi:hypothetical protein